MTRHRQKVPLLFLLIIINTSFSKGIITDNVKGFAGEEFFSDADLLCSLNGQHLRVIAMEVGNNSTLILLWDFSKNYTFCNFLTVSNFSNDNSK